MLYVSMLKKTAHLKEFTCAVLIAIFVYSGITKLWDHQNFTTQVNIFIQNRILSSMLGYAVSFAELSVAVLLAIKNTRRIGLYGFTVMITAFTIYIVVLLLGRRHLPCTCGGFINAFSWPQHLVFNGCLLIIAMTALWLDQLPKKYPGRVGNNPPLTD